jgi:predicted transcriptional regulator YheO
MALEDERRNLVVALEYKGAFHEQRVAKNVARCPGLDRATVYKNLMEVRN